MRIPRSLATVVAFMLVFTSRSALLGAQTPAPKVDVTGKWLFTVTTSVGTGMPTLTLTQKGDSVTGHYSSQTLGEADVAGTIKGLAFTLKLNVEVQGTPLVVTYVGTVDSVDTVKGTADIGGQATGTFTGKRQ